MSIAIEPRDALIVVDIQNDFMPGGALAVKDGDKIVSGINVVMKKFHKNGARNILTQDWHPKDHLSFASRHEEKKPFDPIDRVLGIGPVLWPDHCIQGSKGSEFYDQLDVTMAHLIIRKGIDREIDSYSTFTENDRQTDTGLAGYLKNANLKRIFIGGLALDYCVYWSAMDGLRKGFETLVIVELCKGIAEETIDKAMNDMTENGVKFAGLKDFK
ncbi:MAG: bifunctional nicotinamidase/pyrazinamidase [Deltaproteobacteria bacterium]|nr:MAG: bifunctional nicotinamidase/pyrazinamidase [Deltaproteobacteria bacterium]